jgi:cobalt-precorrin-6B (C15)-methyltransferase
MNKHWPYLVPGIPDDEFIRGGVPMTKREVRALTVCAARFQPGLTVWDVGAGTGSLAVEAALFTPGGRIYAVEKKAAYPTRSGSWWEEAAAGLTKFSWFAVSGFQTEA